MYDLDGDGRITRLEMLEIIEVTWGWWGVGGGSGRGGAGVPVSFRPGSSDPAPQISSTPDFRIQWLTAAPVLSALPMEQILSEIPF
jgi:hypothetical protein